MIHIKGVQCLPIPKLEAAQSLPFHIPFIFCERGNGDLYQKPGCYCLAKNKAKMALGPVYHSDRVPLV